MAEISANRNLISLSTTCIGVTIFTTYVEAVTRMGVPTGRRTPARQRHGSMKLRWRAGDNDYIARGRIPEQLRIDNSSDAHGMSDDIRRRQELTITRPISIGANHDKYDGVDAHASHS